MVYDKHQWRDGEAGTTPVEAQWLNHLEDGIYQATIKAEAGPQAGSIGAQQIIDGSVGDNEIAPNRFLIGSTSGGKAVRDLVGAMSTGWTYDSATGMITLPAPGQSTGGGSDDVVDLNDSAYAGGMSTTKTAAQNGAALQAGTIAAAGRPCTAKAGEYDVSGCALTDQHINWNLPGVYFRHPQGSDPVAVIERTPGTPRPAGPTFLTWWGPYNPTGVTVSGLLQAIPLPSGGFANYKGGRMYRIDSKDAHVWSWSALNLYNVGDTPVYTQTDGLMWQAENFPLLGIGMRVSSISGNSGPLESMMVKGDQSNATGLVQSRLLGNSNGTGTLDSGGNGGLTATEAHIAFTSVSGDFIAGENLVRIAGGNPTYPSTNIAAVGAVVGVVNGPPVLLTNEIFIFQYGRTTAAQATAGTNTPNRTDNTVQLREVDTKPMCRIRGLGLDVVGAREDPDTYVDASLRTDVIQLRGVYMPDVEWRVRNAWTRAMCVWSDYMGHFKGLVDQMPNHAILTQSAFAYGLELKSASKGTLVNLRGHTVRHLFTTNPNQRTYSAANNYQSGKWSQWDYGTPMFVTVDQFDVHAAYAPGMDTHPGDYFTTFRNGRIHGGGSGGRYNTDNNSAFSSRGFGTRWENVEVDASAVGFNIGGVEHDAGMAHRYHLVNVHLKNALVQGVYCPSAMVPGQATIEIDGGTYSMRLNYPRDAAGTLENIVSQKYGVQSCVHVGSGVSLEVSGGAKFRRFGSAALTMRGTGDLTVWDASVDFTECPTSVCGVRMDVGSGITSAAYILGFKGKGTAFAMLRNVSGNTSWKVAAGGMVCIPTTGAQTPSTAVSAGTPTWTNVAAMSVP